MRNKKYLRCKGFTLVEVLVALVIFAVLSALGYRSLSALLQTRERITAETTRWREVMLFFNRIDNDVRQQVNRPVTLGNIKQAAWLAKPNLTSIDDAQLSFSRLGNPQQNGLLMDTQRIGYRLKSGTIEMLIWPALDIESTIKPSVYPILTDVKSMSLRYMQYKTHRWSDYWPVEGEAGTPIPKALEIKLTLNSGETVNRVYSLQ